MVEFGQKKSALPEETEARIPTGEFLALAGFLCFVFWDVYIPSEGIRPLDVIGSVLLILGLCSRQVRRHASRSARYAIPVVCLVVICAATAGVWADTSNSRAAIGICAGAMVFVLFSFWPLSAAGLLRVTSVALIVNLIGFWLQLAWYYATGTVLNFYALLGAEPRLLGSIFRAAGLYLEPASFGLMSFSLLALRVYVSDRFDLIFWVTIASMLASLSLWGVVSAGALVILFAARRPYGLMMVMCATVAATIVVVNTGYWRQLWVLHRLLNLASDPSASVRYGALLHLGSFDLWNSSFWFGGGVRINYEALGASGLSYLFTSVGLLGTVALGACMSFRAKAGWRFYVLVGFLLMLTAAYLWTFMYWWSVLALFGRIDIGTRRAGRVRSALAVLSRAEPASQ